ncbi:MAG TPA: DEAD/DEAH box helicase [Flavisolibacter sp.]|nr:DEAD/DEAH box helicase [Flavisolibacter sp.]
MTFEQLGLIEPLLRALKAEGYTTPTPIQQQAIPTVLEGKDLLGCAQTGTGKTAAFALPMLQALATDSRNAKGFKHIRALILTPTRELATQIHESFISYGKFTDIRQEVIFGGVSQHTQTIALRNGTDVLIATPGRLLDLMNQGYVHLDHLEWFVLDEADRMLDMGFIHDVKRIIKALPQQRQTLFFSATMPPAISGLANSILSNPVRVEVTPQSTTVEKIEQSVFFVGKRDKQALLVHLISEHNIGRTLVFTKTKHGADRVVKDLRMANIKADAIHGNKSQPARQNALANFKSGRLKVLVATDIAARGIDVDNLTHVFNFDLPNVPETYVHRIGRTGRAGASGTSFSFCDREEIALLKDINKLIGQKIPAAAHPFEGASNAAPAPASAAPSPRHRRPLHNGTSSKEKSWNTQ